ncbi:pectinesterase family protein [Paenibacillus harenae]|uniref:Pectin methylesterase-like acyl-CoA thioesterase/fibronectin type 3 domain-containing protein n=1 Tax=Paenibacillus harenae TaxID=306543 RepID=A0ABT9U8Q1_PAEHA|nr:pectinesterase family protein [Paenibacillus harenae]MDQ0114579.1 pectin methylesterase-like acyl-CoA thioesterase/fibronectin type 3 domain-containing protein [Paenibacillus harenae]
MKKWLSCILIVSLLAALFPVSATIQAANDSLPAFPGAEGGGKYVTGGRGQEVYEVTTLEDYKSSETPIPGSLRDGVSQGNRTVVFRVGGTIRLKEKLRIAGSNLTIAGQTAPGDGITVTDYTTVVEADNVIIRYMRFRLGDRVPSEDDAFGLRDRKNIIIDHSSFSWSVDEVLSLYNNYNTTVQWSIIEESMLMSSHEKGRHGYAGIWGGNHASFLNNLIAHNLSRNPRFSGGDPVYDIMESTNNVIYNWGLFSAYGGGKGQYNLNNNYYKYGPNSYYNVRNVIFSEVSPSSQMYVSGNIMDGDAAVTADNWLGVPVVQDSASKLSQPVQVEGGYVPVSAQDAYHRVLASAGAALPKRDAIDARVVQDVKNRTGQHINSPLEVGGYPDYPTVVSTVVDQDHDGMDDAWELANGLSPADPGDRNLTNLSPEGYTNLEVYLHDLIVKGNADNKNTDNPIVSITSPVTNTLTDEGSHITVDAVASDNDGIAKVELIVDGIAIAEDTMAPYSFEWNNVTDGTHYLVVRATDNAGLSTQSDNVAVHVNRTGPIDPWQSQDIGSVGIPGHTQLEGDAQTVTVKSAGRIGGDPGANISGSTADAFHFAYQTLTGNGEIIARIDRVTATDDNAKAGVMIRETLDPSSNMATLAIPYVKFGRKGVMISRQAAGGQSVRVEPDEFISVPYWVKLVRIGNQLTGLISADKTTWKQVAAIDLPMSETVYIGLAADAGKKEDDVNKYNTSLFSGVELHALTADFPTPPQALEATAGDKSAVLGWSPVSVATGYNIKRSDVPGGPYTTIASNVTSPSFTDTNLIAGKTYFYVVTAVNAGGESFDSTEVSVTPTGAAETIRLVDDDFESDAIGEIPAGYTLISPNPATETNKLIAQSVPAASTGNGSSQAMQIFDMGTVNTRAAKTFAPQKGTVIVEADYMQERVIGSAGLLQLQTQDGARTPLSLEIRKPAGESTNVFVVNHRGTYIKVTNEQPAINQWIHIKIEANVLTGKAKIYVDGVPSVTPEIDFESTALSDTQAKGIGRIHFSTPGTGTGSPYWDNVKVYIEPVAAPSGVKAVQGNGAVELKWPVVEGAASYNVKRSETDGGPYATIQSEWLESSFIDNTVSNETTYFYVVTASGVGGESANSNQVQVTPSASAPKPAAPAELRLKSRDSQLDLSWNAVDNVNFYTVKKAADPAGPYEVVASNITETAYRAGGVSNGATQYFTVTATNVAGESVDSAPASGAALAHIGTPGLTAEGGNAKVTLNWTSAAESDHYLLKRATDIEGPYTIVAEHLSGTNYTDTKVLNGQPYYYKVSGANESGIGLESGVAAARPVLNIGQPGVPVGVKADPSDSEVQLSWNAVSGAADYQVVRATDKNGPYSVIADQVIGLSFTDQGLANDTAYYYAVAASNNKGMSYHSLPVKTVPGTLLVVAKDGSGQFTTIADAINAVPDNSMKLTIIKVKNGIYNEKVLIPSTKNRITMIGESREETVLVNGDSASTIGPDGNPLGTSNSYTLRVQGTDFTMENMTVQNDAGRTAGQAVALYAEGDRGIYRNVKLLGYQDTLETNRGRQYFVDSHIEGTVDFIFGDSAIVFENNIIHSVGPGYVTAPSTEKDQPGYVFINNQLTASADAPAGTVDLGRPWRDYGSSTYINNYLGEHIRPTGWNEWVDGRSKTARFSEYASYGPGAGPAGRVNWSTQLTAEEAAQYTIESTLGGSDGWNPKESIGMIDTAPIAVVRVSSISVFAMGGMNAITSKNGSLSLKASVLPGNAANPAVAWGVFEINGVTPTSKAMITADGLLTAKNNGIVKVVATAKDGSGAQGSIYVSISGQTGILADFPVATLDGPAEVSSGQEFSYRVGLSHVSSSPYTSVYAVDFTLQFGTDAVEFISAHSLKSDFRIMAQKTDVPGRVRIIATSLGSAGAVTSGGELIELKFQAKPVSVAVAAPLDFTSFKASNGAAQSFTVLQTVQPVIQVVPSAN